MSEPTRDESNDGWSERVWRYARSRTPWLVFALVVASVAGYLEPVQSMFGLFVHFRHVYLLLGLLFVPVVLWSRVRWFLAPTGFVILLNAAYVLPWYVGGEPAECAEAPTVRVALANILTSNRDYPAIRRLVERTDPDVLVLQEYASHAEEALSETLSAFDHRIARRRRDNFGIAVYSEIPWSSARVKRPTGGPAPQLHLELDYRGEPLHLWAVHPLPPVKPSYIAMRNDLLAHVGAFAASAQAPVVVAGDLNTTMWSAAYRKFEAQGLTNSRAGRGVMGTWPSWLPLRLPIDHVAHTEEIRTCRLKVGPDIGSDHRPLVVDLAL